MRLYSELLSGKFLKVQDRVSRCFERLSWSRAYIILQNAACVRFCVNKVVFLYDNDIYHLFLQYCTQFLLVKNTVQFYRFLRNDLFTHSRATHSAE